MARAQLRWALAAAALLGALALVSPGHARAASLIGDYQFNDSLNSSVPGAPPLTAIAPIGTYSTATVNGQPDRVLAWQTNGGLSFPRPALPHPDSFSTIVTFALDDVSSYRRILAFDAVADDNDNGVYDYDGKFGFYDDTFSPDVVFSNGQFKDVAFTRSSQGLTAGYVNGTPHFNHPDPSGDSIVQADGLMYFKDNSNDENGSGRIARIRVYDGALSPADVKTIETTGGLSATAAQSGSSRVVERKGKPKAVATGITVTCPAEGVPCSLAGALKAQSKGKQRRIGSLKGSVAAGASKPVSIKLSKKGRKLIAKKGKLPVSFNVTITPSSGVPSSASGGRRL